MTIWNNWVITSDRIYGYVCSEADSSEVKCLVVVSEKKNRIEQMNKV